MFAHSTLNSLFALVATMALLTDFSVTGMCSLESVVEIELTRHLLALPTRRSTSSFGRRARISRRALTPPAVKADGKTLAITTTSPTTGKTHSVVIDAGSMGSGGISGSTININLNGKRDASVVAAPVEEPTSSIFEDLGETATAAAPAATEAASHHNVYIDASGTAGIQNSTINVNLNHKKSRRTTPTFLSAHEHHKKRDGLMNTDLALEQAAYEAQVAAMDAMDALATAVPTPTAAPSSPPTDSPLPLPTPTNQVNAMSPIAAPALDSPDVESPLVVKYDQAVLAALPPLTLTITMLPQSTGYVNAAFMHKKHAGKKVNTLSTTLENLPTPAAVIPNSKRSLGADVWHLV